MFPPPAPPKGPTFVERLGKDGAGSRLLAWIGGAVTLLGVVLLLVLAVQRGWLGPLPRVVAGAAFGGVLIGVGVWVHRSVNGRTGAFALAATGIAALYLDAIAATVLYGYLSTVGGLVVGLGVAVGGLLLAARWDSPVLGTAVVAGCAVCAPMITGGVTPLVVAFLLMLQIATMPVQLWKAWPSLALTAGTAPLLASVLSTARSEDPIANAWAAVAAMIIGVVLALVQAKRRVNDRVAAELLVWTAAPALISAVLLPKYQAVAIAGAAAVVMLAVWLTGRYWPKRMTTVAAIATLIAAFQATATAFDGDTRSSVLLGEAILLAVLGLKSRPSLFGALGFGVTGGLLAIAIHVPPSFLVFGPATQTNLPAALLSSVLLLTISILLPAIAFRTGVLVNPAREALPWGFAALYAASGTLLSAALLVDGSRDGFLVGHVIITVSWTVVALVLLLRGINVRLLRVIGLVLVGAAVLKLVLFDLSALDGLARVTAFLGAGIVLLAAGTRYARMVQGSTDAEAGS